MTLPDANTDRMMAAAAQKRDAGAGEEAREIYKAVLQRNPQHADALFQMALLSEKQKEYNEAIEFYKGAIRANSCFTAAYCNLGSIMKAGGMPDTAKKCYEQAIKVDDKSFEAHFGLGQVLRDMRRPDEALVSFLRAAALRDDVEARSNIAVIYHGKGMFQEALPYYRAVLEKDAYHYDTLCNLGALYGQSGRYGEAQELYKRALAVRPNDLSTLNNLSILYKTMGQLDKAIASYRAGLALYPDNVSLHSNLLLAMVYAASVPPEELADTAREFGRIVADPLLRTRVQDVDRDPDRRLRIGYVSPDFRKHAVNYFFGHLLAHHDRDEFEIFAYSNTGAEDDITRELEKKFDHWRNIANMDDDKAADIIEADKIDILVDLTGHTGRNRLSVFARKPAPVQVSWLGYPATTGMKAMDYRITDVYAEPPGMTEHLNVETLWRLPEIFCCYSADERSPAVIDHPPFEDNGYITFGCFNNFTKVTDDVLATWAQIMAQVPGSHLLLEITGVDGAGYRAEVEERLFHAGIALERVTLEPRRKENQFVLYNRIDIALDPFPCAGGTTSMDTLWMGVPFVTLAGQHFVSRMGVTILTNAGMPQLIAHDIESYIDKVVALATDKEELRRLRQGLREKVAGSPLMDQKSFARDMEEAYRGMWKKWCGGAKAGNT